jgi:hypothetical protein
MTIKSLVLGSAAALVAVSSARAADAVMAPEPEPAEYVKVCDAFGSGYFYIPGTETCISINGYVWYEIGATNDKGGIAAGYAQNYNFWAPDGWNADSRIRVNFDTRSQTEWGLLKGQIRLQSDWNGGFDGPVSVDQAWFSIGGLLMGYTESAFVATDANGISSWGSHSWNGLWYGYQQRQLIQYSFGGDKGIFGTISLEDGSTGGGPYDWTPDIVGVLGFQGGWGAVWAKAGYDDEIAGTGDSGYGITAGTQINIPGMEGSSFRLIGYYADSDNAYGSQGPFWGNGAGGTGYGTAEWSVLASYYQQFTPKFGASIGGQYFNNFYLADSDVKSDLNGYSVELSLVWTPLTNFEVRAEGEYDKVDTFKGSTTGYLRFTRFF